jgi:beta-xylosidase
MTLKSETNLFFLALIIVFTSCAKTPKQVQKSGNPVFEGWYADPEGIVFDHEFWIYPTTSDDYKKQVFFDAFSSKDLVHWQKHQRILDKTIKSSNRSRAQFGDANSRNRQLADCLQPSANSERRPRPPRNLHRQTGI